MCADVLQRCVAGTIGYIFETFVASDWHCLSNVNEQSASLVVGAFLTSKPVPRFARTRELHLSMHDNKYSGKVYGKVYSTQEIQTFQAGIKALELPPPPPTAHSPHLYGTLKATEAGMSRSSPSVEKLRGSSVDKLHGFSVDKLSGTSVDKRSGSSVNELSDAHPAASPPIIYRPKTQRL